MSTKATRELLQQESKKIDDLVTKLALEPTQEKHYRSLGSA